MRSVVCLFVLSFAAFLHAGTDSVSGLEAYKSGNYKVAIPLLEVKALADKDDAPTAAALLSALIYEGKLEQASQLAQQLAERFPQSPEAIAARGDLRFYTGELGEAEKLYKTALKIRETTPRAYYGLYRVFRAASMYRSARMMCLRAQVLDPDDALITYAFLRYTTPEIRKQKFGTFIQEHPWFYENYERELQTSSEVRHEMEEHKAYELEGGPKPVMLPLVNAVAGANLVRGVGLEMKIGNGKGLRLLLDTGASGIVITQRAVDKAGLTHLGSTESWGIGDKGTRKGFLAVADTCSIGGLSYKTCVFEALEGKERIAGDEDGIIGTDFFSDYLIHLDFQRHEMKLTPLPSRPSTPLSYDRTVPVGEENFTPVWRLGNHLYISTLVNRKIVGLFLLDTGASLSNIDSTFARLSTKLHGDEYMRVRGVSGQVKDVFEADKAELTFGHFRQSNVGLTAFNLNNAPRHQEVRMSGILGFPLLAMFRLDLDYRNGLVNFDYIWK